MENKKVIIYHWHVSYKTNDNYSHYAQLKANTRDEAIIEANQISNLKKVNELFRRSE